ncbi:MAG: metal ABC transporter permease [Pirellulales bacterium]|nr:metal ABC transporter permease [Pirellulales bacterium]
MIDSAVKQAAGIALAAQSTITDRSISMPTLETLRRVVLLEDYNTRVVVFAVAVLGCAAGIVGSFTLLRKRALMGDALSHATLPGIALAFFVVTAAGGHGKTLEWLLLGATLSGLAGTAVILTLRNMTRLKEDTAMGIVLSVFFAAGIAMLGVAQQMEQGHVAGLESYIFGKTASMGASDAKLIAGAAIVCIVICLSLFNELKLLCFDDGFAASQGYPVVLLDLALMSAIVMVLIVGLQAVGMILMIAQLIIPPAAARFWTDQMWRMLAISAVIGALTGMVGASLSALFPNLPSGAMIVLVCAGCFGFSMIFGSSRGILVRYRRRRNLNRSIAQQHLLRAIYELCESGSQRKSATFRKLQGKRSWTANQLRWSIGLAERAGWVTQLADQVSLTARGAVEAKRLTREHRLWELYLIAYADTAPARVDRQADRIEHVLEPELIAELEMRLEREQQSIPSSPHDMQAHTPDVTPRRGSK